MKSIVNFYKNSEKIIDSIKKLFETEEKLSSQYNHKLNSEIEIKLTRKIRYLEL